MKLSSILAFSAIALTSALVSCAGPGGGFSYKNVTIALTYNPICNGCGNFLYNKVAAPTNPGDQVGPVGAIQMPVGGGTGACIGIMANITNAPPNFTWTIVPSPTPSVPGLPSGTGYPQGVGGTNVGTLSYSTGAFNYYCMPNSIPIYSGNTLAIAQAAGIQQGETEIVVTAQSDPNDPTKTVSATQTFTSQLSSPPSQSSGMLLVGITPAVGVSLPLGSKYQFTGYVVGDNGYYTPPGTTLVIPRQAQIWYVTAPGSTPIAGGNATIGTISSNGFYTAPSAYPPSGKTVTITLASAAFPSIVTGGVGEGSPTIITFQ